MPITQVVVAEEFVSTSRLLHVHVELEPVSLKQATGGTV